MMFNLGEIQWLNAQTLRVSSAYSILFPLLQVENSRSSNIARAVRDISNQTLTPGNIVCIAKCTRAPWRHGVLSCSRLWSLKRKNTIIKSTQSEEHIKYPQNPQERYPKGYNGAIWDRNNVIVLGYKIQYQLNIQDTLTA